jgi:hypothetical protein
MLTGQRSGVAGGITATRTEFAPDSGEMKDEASKREAPADACVQVQPNAGPAGERTIGVCFHFRFSI